MYRRLDGPQGRSGQVRKISPPTGFDPRTVQPVDSRYTDCATRPTDMFNYHNYKIILIFNITVPWYLAFYHVLGITIINVLKST